MKTSCRLPLRILRRTERGLFPGRSPQVSMIARPPHVLGTFDAPNHSGPYGHLQRVPLVLYGPGFVRPLGGAQSQGRVTVADIAPTMAELVDLPWPADRPGRVLHEVLEPKEERPAPPRLIMLVVWDGGGTNVLNRWPGAWPNLKELMKRGTSIPDATVGSSPSVTPATHATMGTGAFPNQHGIVDIPQITGGSVVDSYEEGSPRNLELPTVADLYDAARANDPKVAMFAERGWHLGMMGHGAFLDGGDKDIAVLTDHETGQFVTEPEWYALPSYVNDVPGLEEDRRNLDDDDGRLDSTWRGRTLPLETENAIAFPYWSLYQARVIEAMIAEEALGVDEVTDLFFTNFKQIDIAGHRWNMVNPEVRDSVEYADIALGGMIEFLDEAVGEQRWVMILTADHGQAALPLPKGGWGIDPQELDDDIAEALGMKTDALIEQHRPTGLWLTPEALERRGLAGRISDFIVDYRIRDNLTKGQRIPTKFRDRLQDRLFLAGLPSSRIDDAIDCASER
ncbi:MAG: alkaline phosphatase family protein [Actinomycetota bacterium]